MNKQHISDIPNLMAEWDWEENEKIGLNPALITRGSGKRANWVCSKGHKWDAAVFKRVKGNNCPYCSGRLVTEENCLKNVNPELAREWDNEKNYPLTTNDVSFSSGKQFWWKCDKGHSWQATVNSRNNGNACPYCSGRRATEENNLAFSDAELTQEWDYERNGDVNPKNVTPHSGYLAWWKCPQGHIYQRSVAKRMLGQGCPICSHRKIIPGVNDLATTHPALVLEWNFTKNKSNHPTHVHSGSSVKVWWKCANGHEWQASIINRVRGKGCPFCSGRVASKTNNLALMFPDLLEEWDYEKNPLPPENYTPFSNKKVWWRCKLNHSWEASVNKRSAGHKCPICWKEMRTSFPEQCLLYYTRKFFPNAINSYILLYADKVKVEFDIYIEEINTAIEYDGSYFHKAKARFDIQKNMIAKESGIRLIRLREERCPYIEGCEVVSVDSGYINNNFESLEKGIQEVISLIGGDIADIDINRDSNLIFNQYIDRVRDRSIANTYPELLQEWNYEKNKDVLPQNISFGSGKKVWWKCTICGYEWQSSITHRKSGRGCPSCAGKVLIPGRNDLATIFPEISIEWDYEKNAPLQPSQVFSKSHKKVWWKCQACGYEWETAVSNRTSLKRGCPACSKKERNI